MTDAIKNKQVEAKTSKAEPALPKTYLACAPEGYQLNVRSSADASKDTNILGTIANDVEVEVEFIKDGWAKISCGSIKAGFAKAEYLKEVK